jgi:hypothetical protein
MYDCLNRKDAAILAQIRSGYCRLRSYLVHIKAVEDSQCECGEVETVKHFILECPRWIHERRILQEKVGHRSEELAFLLGVYTSEAVDGPQDKWQPKMQAVRETVDFVKRTKRLEPEAV